MSDNGNMPAMPQSGFSTVSDDRFNSSDCGGDGLTKREHFAAMAMQGIMVSRTFIEMKHVDDFACVAVKAADELLKALEQVKE